MNSTWALIIILSFITFINRYTFFSKFVKYHPGKELREFLNFSLQAILTALWVPIVFSYSKSGEISYTDMNYLIATIFVFVLGVFRINMLLVVFLGLSLFFILKFNLLGF